jgi:hypothetical protein
MSLLTFEEFKEYLLFQRLPEGISEISFDFPLEGENPTIPIKDTDYFQWAYENKRWISKIGLQYMKSYFLSLIYNPYDEEMVDITTDFQEPSDNSTISLKYISTTFQDDSELNESSTSFQEPTESELIQMLTLLLNNSSFQGMDETVQETMEVD